MLTNACSWYTLCLRLQEPSCCGEIRARPTCRDRELSKCQGGMETQSRAWHPESLSQSLLVGSGGFSEDRVVISLQRMERKRRWQEALDPKHGHQHSQELTFLHPDFNPSAWPLVPDPASTPRDFFSAHSSQPASSLSQPAPIQVERAYYREGSCPTPPSKGTIFPFSTNSNTYV